MRKIIDEQYHGLMRCRCIAAVDIDAVKVSGFIIQLLGVLSQNGFPKKKK